MADTGMGEMAPVTEEIAKQLELTESMNVFRTGEIVTVKGSRFRIEFIDRQSLVLSILPHHD